MLDISSFVNSDENCLHVASMVMVCFPTLFLASFLNFYLSQSFFFAVRLAFLYSLFFLLTVTGEEIIVARPGLEPGPLAYRASTLPSSYRATWSSFDISPCLIRFVPESARNNGGTTKHTLFDARFVMFVCITFLQYRIEFRRRRRRREFFLSIKDASLHILSLSYLKCLLRTVKPNAVI